MKDHAAPSGSKPLEQSGEHSFDFDELSLGFTMFGSIDHLQVPREQKKILEFAGGSHGHMQELTEFGAPPAAATLRNVRRNRTGCTPDLAAKSVAFFRRKPTRNSVNFKNKPMAAAPNLQLAKILHFALPFQCANGATNYL